MVSDNVDFLRLLCLCRGGWLGFLWFPCSLMSHITGIHLPPCRTCSYYSVSDLSFKGENALFLEFKKKYFRMFQPRQILPKKRSELPPPVFEFFFWPVSHIMILNKVHLDTEIHATDSLEACKHFFNGNSAV